MSLRMVLLFWISSCLRALQLDKKLRSDNWCNMGSWRQREVWMSEAAFCTNEHRVKFLLCPSNKFYGTRASTKSTTVLSIWVATCHSNQTQQHLCHPRIPDPRPRSLLSIKVILQKKSIVCLLFKQLTSQCRVLSIEFSLNTSDSLTNDIWRICKN